MTQKYFTFQEDDTQLTFTIQSNLKLIILTLVLSQLYKSMLLNLLETY